ncbi:hypothetical protein CAEBREN_09383 [Caenorhabditis brenneri]|uniref:Uncharacterized protein n=1 Tax=Caenorhabditis brenneri TaxID=135651 RepID=G0MR21_CAEBE|nr:hypothetical protein CAEBREN_09383 [Caenorhabditis brenneri]
MGTLAGLINLHTLCYRTQRAKCLDSSEVHRKTLRFSWHYILPLSILIAYNIPNQDHVIVHADTKSQHPDYHLEIYRNFGGVANAHTISANYIMLSLSLGTFYVPVIGGYWKTVAMKKLKSNFSSVVSNQNRRLFEALIKGLNLQILLPLCCYIPISLLFCWNKYSGEQILISQYTLGFLISVPCIFDPLLQIYFIIPYRNATWKLFAC